MKFFRNLAGTPYKFLTLPAIAEAFPKTLAMSLAFTASDTLAATPRTFAIVLAIEDGSPIWAVVSDGRMRKARTLIAVTL